jgi:hypothetical protein
LNIWVALGFPERTPFLRVIFLSVILKFVHTCGIDLTR